MFEARFYTTGWAFRFGLMQMRWTIQENYKGLSIEWVGRSYFSAGGLTWKEFRIMRQQQRDAATARREAAKAEGQS